MKIAIFGAGYVGLSTAVCLATKHCVTLIDIDDKKVKAIKNGKPLIYEPGLDTMLEDVTASGRLKVSNTLEKFPQVSIVFIAVGTPSDSDGYINLLYVRDVIKTISQRKSELLNPTYSLIVIRSTVIPGTTTRMLKHLNSEEKIGIAFSPEFLAQGTAIKNTLYPSRVIVGANDSKAASFLENFFVQFYEKTDTPILKMSIESAEFSKYAANALLAMKISFANEVANIVESVNGADIGDIMRSVGLDKRISSRFLRAGIGFGGSCFPKDVRALIQFTQDIQANKPVLLSAVLQVNENRPLRIIQLLRERIGELYGKKIAVLGLAYKPGTNDIRETPALAIIRSLWRNGAKINVHDPILDKIDLKQFKRFDIHFSKDILSCVANTDACIFLTEWPEYQNLEIDELTSGMLHKLVIDGRRIFAEKRIPNDVYYITIGSPTKCRNTNFNDVNS
jgi:UDPglucose 6-dehydrogenase